MVMSDQVRQIADPPLGPFAIMLCHSAIMYDFMLYGIIVFFWNY